MKFIFIEAAFPPPFLGGKEKQLFFLVREILKNTNITVQVLSRTIKGEETTQDDLGCVKRLNSNSGLFLYLLLLSLKSTRKDTVYYINTPSRIGQLAVLACSLRRHNIIFKVSSESVINFLKQQGLLVGYIKKNVKIFHVLSQSDFEALINIGISPNKIFLNYNGIEIPSRKIEVYMKSQQINLIFVGRINKNKNLLNLIKSLHQVIETKKDISFNLQVCGDGTHLSECIDYVKNNNLAETVEFCGFLSQKEVSEKLIMSDFLILPSYSEGMSNALLEAASIGLPISCSRVGAYREILGGYSDFLSFDPFKSEDIVNTLIRISKLNNGERKKYGEYLRERTETNFSIEKTSSNIVKAAAQLLHDD